MLKIYLIANLLVSLAFSCGATNIVSLYGKHNGDIVFLGPATSSYLNDITSADTQNYSSVTNICANNALPLSQYGLALRFKAGTTIKVSEIPTNSPTPTSNRPITGPIGISSLTQVVNAAGVADIPLSGVVDVLSGGWIELYVADESKLPPPHSGNNGWIMLGLNTYFMGSFTADHGAPDCHAGLTNNYALGKKHSRMVGVAIDFELGTNRPPSCTLTRIGGDAVIPLNGSLRESAGIISRAAPVDLSLSCTSSEDNINHQAAVSFMGERKSAVPGNNNGSLNTTARYYYVIGKYQPAGNSDRLTDTDCNSTSRSLPLNSHFVDWSGSQNQSYAMNVISPNSSYDNTLRFLFGLCYDPNLVSDPLPLVNTGSATATYNMTLN